MTATRPEALAGVCVPLLNQTVCYSNAVSRHLVRLSIRRPATQVPRPAASMRLQCSYNIIWISKLLSNGTDANLDHIARHQVSPEEAEQIIENDPLDIEAETVDGEERTTSIGCTDRGRFLVVVTTLREKRSRCDGVPSSQGPDRSVLCPERGMKPWRTNSNYPNLPARPKRRNGGPTTAKKSPKLSRMLRPAANCSPARPPSSPASPELA